MKKLVLSIFVLVLMMYSAYAQNEVLRQVNSLRGIAEFGIAIEVEHPTYLNDYDFDLGAIRREAVDKLNRLSAAIVSDQELRTSDQYPLLRLHINIMRAANGTFPYAVELTFYQPVKLTLNRDLESMAATWQTSFVGIVSEDLLGEVAPSAVSLVDDFADDFSKVNM